MFVSIENHLISHADLFQDLTTNEVTSHQIIGKSLLISKSILRILDISSSILTNVYDKELMTVMIKFLEAVGFPTKKFLKVALSNYEKSVKKSLQLLYLNSKTKVLLKKKNLIIIASFSKETFGKMIYISSSSLDILQIKSQKLLGNKINELMPYCYSKDHDSYVTSFSEKNQFSNNQHMTSIFDYHHFINQVNISYKMYPYISQDIRIVS